MTLQLIFGASDPSQRSFLLLFFKRPGLCDAPLRAAEPGHASQPGKPVLVDAAVQTDFAPCSHASQSRGGGGGGGVSF